MIENTCKFPRGTLGILRIKGAGLPVEAAPDGRNASRRLVGKGAKGRGDGEAQRQGWTGCEFTLTQDPVSRPRKRDA